MSTWREGMVLPCTAPSTEESYSSCAVVPPWGRGRGRLGEETTLHRATSFPNHAQADPRTDGSNISHGPTNLHKRRPMQGSGTERLHAGGKRGGRGWTAEEHQKNGSNAVQRTDAQQMEASTHDLCCRLAQHQTAVLFRRANHLAIAVKISELRR